MHILHDNTLTLDNREKFSYLAGQYNQLVKFYNVDELCKDELQNIVRLFPMSKNHYATVGMFYRYFIPSVLPANLEKNYLPRLGYNRQSRPERTVES